MRTAIELFVPLRQGNILKFVFESDPESSEAYQVRPSLGSENIGKAVNRRISRLATNR